VWRNTIKERNMRKGKLGFLDPIIAVGVGLSVAVALILVLMGQDEVLSLVVGLTLTGITLSVDIMGKLKESEKRLMQVAAIGNLLISNRETASTVSHLLESFLVANDSWFELFRERAHDALIECRDTLEGLADGWMIARPATKFAFGLGGFTMAKESVKAVSYEALECWKSPHFQASWQAEIEAIKRGITVTRIFIQSDECLSQFDDVLRSHKEAEEQVWTVSPKALQPELLTSYLIVDDKMLVEFELTLEGKLKQERISIIRAEIDRANNKFQTSIRYARPYRSTPSQKAA
jgi:hypothetical protein